MREIKNLFTGTGRCGTVYAAKSLTYLGHPCGHESFFDFKGINGAIARLRNKKPLELSYTSKTKLINDKLIFDNNNWVDLNLIESESSYMSAPFLDNPVLKNTKIVHLVRNPTDVVSSFCYGLKYFNNLTMPDPYEKFIYQWLPELTYNMTQIERACLYYIKWDELIENKIKYKNHIVHKIEDNFCIVLDYLKILHNGNVSCNKRENTSKKTNQEEFYLPKSSFVKKDFDELINKYGYQ